ncbi:MAG TPA: FAD-binding oxidoreductase [Actinomycetes bacterium]|nr:FAD-binding oxidoreductase [Actinomycetes bacterium]
MHPDVIVVGCGVQGLSIARHLARRHGRVLAIDRVGPGRQTSQRAAGQSVTAQTDPAMGSLMQRSIADITEFEAMTGIPLPYHQVGSVKYARHEWSAEQLQREVKRAGGLGATISMVPLEEAREIAPHTNPFAAVAAWHAPDDIYFDPADLAAALYGDAAANGVEFRFGLEVTGLALAGSSVQGVRTTSGDIHCGQVVVAAGSWTGPLLSQTLGVDLPLTYVRHQYSIRTGVPGVSPSLPSVRVVEDAVYARPFGTDLMFGTYEPHPMEFVASRLPARTEQVPLDSTAVNCALDNVGDIFPSARGSEVREMRGGVVTMTPDGSYLIDQVNDVDGLYFLAGCNVMGLSVAPALGRDVADWVLSGRRPPTLAGFAVSRFPSSTLGDLAVKRRGIGEYEGIYRDQESRSFVRA